jgi:hypothetical protein
MHTAAEALDRLLDPLSQALTPEVARKIVELRADPKVQELMDDYADRNTEGELTPEELSDYEALVSAFDMISILQAKARKVLART